MTSKKDKDNIWSMSYEYKLTPEDYSVFGIAPEAIRRHQIEQEMELLRDIDMWVDVCGDDLPEAQALLKKIMDK